MRANVLRVSSVKKSLCHIFEGLEKSNIIYNLFFSEEYDRLNAQIPKEDTKKDKNKKHEVNKNKSILLQKIENKNKWKMPQNEQGPTQDTVLSVIY